MNKHMRFKPIIIAVLATTLTLGAQAAEYSDLMTFTTPDAANSDPTGQGWTGSIENVVGPDDGSGRITNTANVGVILDGGNYVWQIADQLSATAADAPGYDSLDLSVHPDFFYASTPGFGWVLTAVMREVVGDGWVSFGSSALGTRWGTYALDNSSASPGTFVLRPYNVIALQSDPLDASVYHTLQVFSVGDNAGTTTAQVMVDGELMGSWTGSAHTGAYSQNNVRFESGSSAGINRVVNWESVTFQVITNVAPAPAPVVNPVPATRDVGDSVTFTAAFTNLIQDFQWYKVQGGVTNAIPGATRQKYSIAFVTVLDAGEYFARATNYWGAAETAQATLTVNADVVPPAIARAKAVLTLQHIKVSFTEPCIPETMTDSANYTFQGGAATVSSVTPLDAFSVELRTSDLTPGANYVLQVSDVLDYASNSIAGGAQTNVLVPNLVVSAVKYDAGTSASGPPDPTSAPGGNWITNASVSDPGLYAQPVINDNGTGLNAWQVVDALTTSGFYTVNLPVDAASDALAITNGWRLTTVARIEDDFGAGISGNAYYRVSGGRRYLLWLDLDADLNLVATLQGGSSYTLTTNGPSDSKAYHTHSLVYDPETELCSYYFDGTLITDSYNGDTGGGNGVIFGSGSTGGMTDMRYHTVQLDVVGGTQPVVTLNPSSSTNAVGQQVTFDAGFTPFVGDFMWYSNGVPVARGSSSYTTPFTQSGNDGDQYYCEALHALGNVQSAIATLTITSDTNPPTIAGVTVSLLLDRLQITFSEPVLATYATNIANYVFVEPGLKVLSAELVDPLTVQLRTTALNSDSNYTLQVSNIRDTSNLVIAPNSPAAINTAKLAVMARYDAGDTTNQPAGPPDPTTPAGGSWAPIVEVPDPDITSGPVVDDLGTGLNAWNVTDYATTAGAFLFYQITNTPAQHAAFRANGYVLTVRGRFVDDLGYSYATFAQYGDDNNHRFLFWFDLDANLALASTLAGDGTFTLTPDYEGNLAYHLYQVVYTPPNTNASFYVDGELVSSDWAGETSVYTYNGVAWGSGSSANLGSMNYNLVEFKAVEPAVPLALAVSLNGSDVEVSYTGVLEAASAVTGTYSPVATNATTSPAVYVIPAASQQSQQYFRTRSP